MAALELDGVTVRFGRVTVLDGIDLAIPAGQRVALVGPNGSGKTTLLRTLAGIVRPVAGGVRPADGMRRHEIARVISFLPQEEYWEFPFTVAELVHCGRYVHAAGLFGATTEDHAAVDTAIAAVGLAEMRERPVTELSGGERRRAVLARALAQRAPVLLLDEPTTALDLEHRQAILGVLADRQGTVVFATHELDVAAAHAERVLVMDGGRLAADGAPEEVITDALLREVFRVEARVLRVDGRIHVVAQ